MNIHDPRPQEKRQKKYTKGRNSESFDPKSTFSRPDMRIRIEDACSYLTDLKHDDVIIIPDFVSDDMLYEKLLDEIQQLQNDKIENSEWISWHEGCHLIVKSPENSKIFKSILDKMHQMFDIDPNTSSFRFNFYKDDTDWKSLHHDSAAFNPLRAKTQNITVGLSLGYTRELCFRHVNGTTLAFPQKNLSLFSFGRDVNIRFKHGINAIPHKKRQHHNCGRISIILWGWSSLPINEAGDPPLVKNKEIMNKKNHTHTTHK